MKKNKHSLKISRSFFGETTLDGYIRAEKQNPDFVEITIGEYEDFINSKD